MSKAAIVFISDIHYSKDREKSQFQENDENEYYQKWENYVLGIEKLQDTKVKYLVISGDLAESARRKEYIVLEKILNRFCDKFRFLYKGIIIKHNKTEPTYTKTSLFLCEKRRFLWPGLRKEGNLFKLAGPGGLAFFHLTKKEVSKWPMKK